MRMRQSSRGSAADGWQVASADDAAVSAAPAIAISMAAIARTGSARSAKRSNARRTRSRGSGTGSVNAKRAPRPARDSTRMVPRFSQTSCRAMLRPRPNPRSEGAIADGSCRKRSKRSAMSPAARPGP